MNHDTSIAFEQCHLFVLLINFILKEHLHLVHNDLTILRGDLAKLTSLRVLNARYNNLTSANISTEIFNLEDLTVLVSIRAY